VSYSDRPAFWAKVELFFVLPKFDWKKILQKVQKEMVQEGWNYKKMPRENEFWPYAGRESLWTTGEKVGFSKAHCEVQKQPNLDFSFRGLNPSPLLKFNLHMKSLGLDSWPPGSSKSPIFPNFEVNLTKYIRTLKSADHGRTFFFTILNSCSTNVTQFKNLAGLSEYDNESAVHLEYTYFKSLSYELLMVV
jgi:hypothetical protein